jgi:hypothetical protein
MDLMEILLLVLNVTLPERHGTPRTVVAFLIVANTAFLLPLEAQVLSLKITPHSCSCNCLQPLINHFKIRKLNVD